MTRGTVVRLRQPKVSAIRTDINPAIFVTLAQTLREDGGTSLIAECFPDQELVDTMLCVMDFHYDDNRVFISDLLDTLREAEATKTPPLDALHAWLDPLLDAHADEIEEEYAH